jgi:thiol-disulfide isomerase/thioredoxin
MTGVWILLLALAAATAFGLWRRATDGRMKSTTDGRPVPLPDDAPAADLHDAVHEEHGGDVLTAAAIGTSLGDVATLVQFSSAFCQPCRATRRILDEVAQMVPGVTHVEIDGFGPIPHQVDGDYLGDVEHLDLRYEPDALSLVVPRVTAR